MVLYLVFDIIFGIWYHIWNLVVISGILIYHWSTSYTSWTRVAEVDMSLKSILQSMVGIVTVFVNYFVGNEQTWIRIILHTTRVPLLQAKYRWLSDDWRCTGPKAHKTNLGSSGQDREYLSRIVWSGSRKLLSQDNCYVKQKTKKRTAWPRSTGKSGSQRSDDLEAIHR